MDASACRRDRAVEDAHAVQQLRGQWRRTDCTTEGGGGVDLLAAAEEVNLRLEDRAKECRRKCGLEQKVRCVPTRKVACRGHHVLRACDFSVRRGKTRDCRRKVRRTIGGTKLRGALRAPWRAGGLVGTEALR
ncbi:hypothetical protein ERJ75_000347700 [Trypanosoma vivax]|nr:hypothetical protein ERJ75_000347300 [Trypanosoma vivax]KAH8617832.1 hypothetical protein ERJ75_000347700 [Trypanosoma vivax]